MNDAIEDALRILVDETRRGGCNLQRQEALRQVIDAWNHYIVIAEASPC